MSASLPIDAQLRQSLRWRLPALICGLFFVVLVVVVYAAYREVESTLEQAASDRARAAAEQLATIFSRSGQQSYEQLQRVAPAAAAYLRHGDEASESAFRAAVGSLAPVATRRITLWNATGRRAFEVPPWSPGSQGVERESSPAAPGISPLRAAGRQVFAEVGVPLKSDDGTVLGALSFRSIISVSTPEALNRLVGTDARILLGNRSGDLWTNLVDTVEGPPIDLKVDGTATYRKDGVDVIGGLRGLTGTPWVVWVEFPRALAVARATTFVQRMSGFGIVIAIGTLLLMRWLTVRVTRPLVAITVAAEGIAAGDYSRRVQTGRADEIGRLGRAFNTMADEVAASHHELEERVQKRTHDLNAALAALNRQSRERETYLATIVDSSADAIIAQDLNGNVTTWNKSAERIFGFATAEIVGTSLLQLAPPDRKREEAQILESIRNGESVENFQTVRLTRGGRRIDVTITASPIKNAAGRIIGASEVTRDITERRTLEAQYLQAQKMEAVGRLAGGVAHDFNNLLTAILGYCELLLGGMHTNDPLRADVLEVQKAGTSAAGLTRQLLTFSRKQLVQPTLLDLNLVVNEMRAMLSRLIREDVTIVMRVTPEPAIVLADRGQIEQILLNLAVNARDAMPSGGTLTIETTHVELDEHYAAAHFNVAPGHYVLLSVSDTGVGMTPEVQAHIFEPFFTTKEVGQGTGLGLATVHGIVTRSGGSVGVYSELNKGTTFKVYLPVAGAAPEAAPGVEFAGGRPFGQRTILVVDDADHVRELARRLLQRQGYRVMLAENAQEARELFAKVPSIDVLLTDVVMPGSSGPELTRQLVDDHHGLKVIYMSGYTEEAIMTHGVLNPGIAFLHKPFTSDALARKIREVLTV